MPVDDGDHHSVRNKMPEGWPSGRMNKTSEPRKVKERTPRATRDLAKLDRVVDAPLNFKVSAEFRREFKTYAAQHNKKLKQLLYEAFAALKASHVE